MLDAFTRVRAILDPLVVESTESRDKADALERRERAAKLIAELARENGAAVAHTLLSLARAAIGRTSGARAYAHFCETLGETEAMPGQAHHVQFVDNGEVIATVLRALATVPGYEGGRDVLVELMRCATSSVAVAAAKAIEQLAWSDSLTAGEVRELLYVVRDRKLYGVAASLAWVRPRHRGDRALERMILNDVDSRDEMVVLAALGAHDRLELSGPEVVERLWAVLRRSEPEGSIQQAVRSRLMHLGAYVSPRAEVKLADRVLRVIPLSSLVQTCGVFARDGVVFVPSSKGTERSTQRDELRGEEFALIVIQAETGESHEVTIPTAFARESVGVPNAHREMVFLGENGEGLVFCIQTVVAGVELSRKKFFFRVADRSWWSVDANERCAPLGSARPSDNGRPIARVSAGHFAEASQRNVASDLGERWRVDGWPDLVAVNDSVRELVPSVGAAATVMLCHAAQVALRDGSIVLAVPANIASTAGPPALIALLRPRSE